MKTIYHLLLTIYKRTIYIWREWSIVNGQSSIYWSKGQALVTLLFFMIMGITITTAAVVVILTDAAAASLTQQGIEAKYIAESGINEGLLHLLRNPTFTGNETFSVGDGSVTVQITSTSIIATGSAANVVRTVQAQTVYNNNIVTISSEKEL